MRWQRIAQLAIAVFVLGFIGLLVVSMRRGAATPQGPTQKTPDPPPEAKFYSPDPSTYQHFEGDKKVFEFKCGAKLTQTEGGVLCPEGARVLTNRNDKQIEITAKTVEAKLKGTAQIESATFKGAVSMTTAGGVDLKTEEASYVEAEGIVKVPGAATFRKGRMSGSGVGATYDRNRDTLWILDKAKITVAPGKDGKGALDGEATAIGMARADHYVKLTQNARLTGEGRAMHADEITITLTEDDERVQMAQLRGNSRITGGAGGPQSMTAQDIDLLYAEDGRTLQNANLMQRAAVQLAGPGRKRIAGNVINIGMAPNGSTVTHLSATESVQVDLPAEPKVPAKRIRAAALVANGAPDSGLRNATFTGGVEYKETQAAARNVPAIDRTAHSDSLIIETKPGLGAIEKAEFRANVTFDEAPDLHGEGPHAIYEIEKGRLEILSSDYPGKPPRISDGKISVNARTVAVTLGGRELTADTKVRSTILAKQNRSRGQQQAKVPSVLKQDKEVNITSNRLHYLSSTSKATYSGNVTMWQDTDEKDGATIKGDALVIDDKTANLEVKGNAVTMFNLEETNKKTGEKKKTLTTAKADSFEYQDERRVATYTGNAQFEGAQGNLQAPRIQVTLEADSNEVKKLEAWAEGKLVTVKEAMRTVTGVHLTYTAANDTYLMLGTPVIVREIEKGNCRQARGASVEFVRGAEAGNWKLQGAGPYAPSEVEPCTDAKR